MRPRLLTINGETLSMRQWSLRPGAVHMSTIAWRLKVMGWKPEMAVFAANLRPVGGGAFSRLERVRRKQIRFAPAPELPKPILPRWCSVLSINFRRAA